MVGTCLELSVLARLLLHVEVDVAVLVASGLVVDGRIDQTQLLANTGHQVGSLGNGSIFLQRVQQAYFSRLEVVDAPIAFGKRSIGTCRLIDVAIAFEQFKCLLRQIACQQRVGHVDLVDQRQSRGVVVDKGDEEVNVL